jgi:hypothetical protein
VDPDAVVKALLKPDGHPAGDLGATLLAVHRAGAAACETVSKGAVPSEKGLVGTMSDARGRFADLVVDAASSSMEPIYAGLFVRDFLDDAEQGALSLYRTAISKGVSPPIAVDRVAAVYGVPAKSLGKYATLAIDPKANQVALTDAADRCLLTYISKTVDSETSAGQSVEFTKAGEDQAAAFDPNEHPRGGGGRFVPNGQSAPEVADAPVTKPPRVVERVTRKTRQVRQIRQTRATRQDRTQQEEATQRPVLHTQVNRVVNRKMSKPGQAAKIVQLRLNPRDRALHTVVRQQSGPPATPPSRRTSAIPDLLKPLPKTGDTYYELPYVLVMNVPGDVSASMQQKMRVQAGGQADPSTLMFRMGHLQGLANSPFPEMVGRKGAKEAMQAAHDERVNLNEFSKGPRTAIPTSRRIDDSFIKEWDKKSHPNARTSVAIAEWMESERQSEFTHYQTKPDGTSQLYRDDDEDEHVQIYNGYRELGYEHSGELTDTFVVHWHPADDAKPGARPRPVVAEYVIAGEAQGYQEGPIDNEDKWDFTLDPNTVYKVIRPPYMSEREPVGPEVMYDPDRKVVVERYYIQPIDDEDVGEALGSIKKAADFEQEHPRGQGGQFIAAEQRESTVAKPVLPVRTPPPAQRQERQQRSTRNIRTTRVTREQKPDIEHSSITPISRRMIHTRINERKQRTPLAHAIIHRMVNMPATPGMPVLEPLSDSSAYRVFNNFDFNDIKDTISDEDYTAMFNGEAITLNGVTRGRIMQATDRKVESLSELMRYNTEVELESHNQEIIGRPIGQMQMGLVPDHDAIAEKVGELFNKFGEVDQVELVRKGQTLFFYGNWAPASAQVLIQMPLNISQDDPMVLQFVGQRRAHDVKVLMKNNLKGTLTDVGFRTGDATVTSPEIQIFKVTNPVVDRYTLRNQ